MRIIYIQRLQNQAKTGASFSPELVLIRLHQPKGYLSMIKMFVHKTALYVPTAYYTACKTSRTLRAIERPAGFRLRDFSSSNRQVR
jgi:hypothetical protein